MTETLNAKDAESSIKSFRNIAANIMPLIVAFSGFSRKCEETSEVCKYWNEIVEMTNRLQNFFQQIEKAIGTITYKLLGTC